jgi:hypothetical protein
MMSKIREWLAGASPEEREQRLLLPAYLAAAGEGKKLYRLLTDFDFIQAKVDALGVQPAIQDCRLVTDASELLSESQTKTLKLIQGALDLSAHVLGRDKTQLAGQFLGRLMSFEVPDIQKLLEAAKQWKEKPWLRPLTPSLTPPGGALLRTLTGHTNTVWAVALTPDGKTAETASWDSTLKVWDLLSGESRSSPPRSTGRGWGWGKTPYQFANTIFPIAWKVANRWGTSCRSNPLTHSPAVSFQSPLNLASPQCKNRLLPKVYKSGLTQRHLMWCGVGYAQREPHPTDRGASVSPANICRCAANPFGLPRPYKPPADIRNKSAPTRKPASRSPPPQKDKGFTSDCLPVPVGHRCRPYMRTPFPLFTV